VNVVAMPVIFVGNRTLRATMPRRRCVGAADVGEKVRRVGGVTLGTSISPEGDNSQMVRR